MKGFDLYQVVGNLYRIDRFDNIRMYFPHSKTWKIPHARVRTVRKHGKLIAKNVVFK